MASRDMDQKRYGMIFSGQFSLEKLRIVQGGQLEQFHFDTSGTYRTAPLDMLYNK